MPIYIDLKNKRVELSIRDLAGLLTTPVILEGITLVNRGRLGQKLHSTFFENLPGEQEVFVQREETIEGISIRVGGRIDHSNTDERGIYLDELKTVALKDEVFNKLDLTDLPFFENQLKLYAAIYPRKAGEILRPRLILVNLPTGEVREFKLSFRVREYKQYYLSALKRVVDIFNQRQESVLKKKILGEKLLFPFPELRGSQREMALAMKRTLDKGENLLMEAPTGCGKTAGILYPALKFALLNDHKVFFATSKNTQQQIVMETIKSCRGVKTVFLKAAEQMCLAAVRFCSVQFCPYLRNFLEYGRVVVDELLKEDLITPQKIYSVSRERLLCPFETSLSIAEHCDLIVGDYNYVFDPRATIQRFFLNRSYSHFILVCDEIHNLVERSRDYYSCTLSLRGIKQAVQYLQDHEFRGKEKMHRTLKQLISIFKQYYERGKSEFPDREEYSCTISESDLLPLFEEFENFYTDYLLEIEEALYTDLINPLRDLYFDFQNFLSILREENPGSYLYFSAAEGGTFQIFCREASSQLARRIQGFHAVVGMSATLNPYSYYAELLGFDPGNSRFLSLRSPFPPENRKILILPEVDTRYTNRNMNLLNIVDLIQKVISVKRGNYLVFFPSFEFLEQVSFLIRPEGFIKLVQRRRMSTEEREIFLTAMRGQEEPHLLLGVQGGVFAEGVDYLGDTAIGVILAGPLIPPPTVKQELICKYYQDKKGQGFEYAYLYPGMNRTIQAAGRVIRSEDDRGVIVLLGTRFLNEQYQCLFPSDWKAVEVVKGDEIENVLVDFWGDVKYPDG
ncbi:ATP-dependent DNA helicase [bacterium]|nr:ATP-dependent DNA helicase [bacterium]